MRGASWLRSSAIALVAIAAVAQPAPARRDRSAFGDYVKAARLLGAWRYDEARTLIEDLATRQPGTAETRWLLAELAFLDGEYKKAALHLDGIADDTGSGAVGELRRLVATTHEVTDGFATLESAGGHFQIVYAPGKDEAIAALAGEVLDAAWDRLGEDLGYQPAEAVRVEILGRPADLAMVSTLSEKEIETTGTIALCKYNKLMLVSPRATLFGYAWMDTLVHEYVHYVVARASHDEVPVWLQEGLARFEQTRWREAPGGQLSAVDKHLLGTALKNRRLITFDEMHPSMAKLPSQEAAALAFAEVFTMVQFVHATAGYEGVRKTLELTRDGKSAKRAVAEVLDRKWTEVERDWKAYLKKLDLQPQKTLAGRAGARRIRFDKGGEDSENVGVEEVASEKARKLARIAGMLRVRGMSDAAAIEYEKALAIVGEGEPFIAAKLSRVYLELGKYAEAIALAAPLLGADDNDASPATTLGVAHAALGDMPAARDAFEIALRVSPFDPVVRCGLAEAYAATGDGPRAGREKDACTLVRP
jgi:tetratricopeptide (TPR) repeat protein